MHLFWSWSIYCTYLPYSYTVWEDFFYVKGYHYWRYLHTKQYSWNDCWDKVGITNPTFGTMVLRVSRCFNLIFNISLSTSVCLKYFQQKRKKSTPLNNYQPESSQLLNITISAVRQPVFVYRSGKCMYWDYDWIGIIQLITFILFPSSFFYTIAIKGFLYKK